MPGIAHDFPGNELVCMLQDLHTVYVYWDFTAGRMRTLADFLTAMRPEMQLTLRLCRRDASLPEQEIILTTLEPGGRYFFNLDDAAAYQVELGASSPTGEFVLFSRTPVPWLRPRTGAEPGAGSASPPVGLLPEWAIPREKELPDSIFSWS